MGFEDHYDETMEELEMDKKRPQQEIHDRDGCTPATSDCLRAGHFVDTFLCRICGKEWRG